MKKNDLLLAALIGFLNGVFFLFLVGQELIKKILPTPFLFPFFCAFLAMVGMTVASFLGKKVFIIYQAAKFFLVGTLNTFIDLGLVNLLMSVTGIQEGFSYSVFKTVSFLAATTNSYLWNKFWTFEKKTGEPAEQEFFKFLVVTAAGLGINVGVASLLVNAIGPQFGFSKKAWAGAIVPIIAAFFAFLWNFLSSKFIVFKK